MADFWQLFSLPVRTPTTTLTNGTVEFFEPGTTGASNRKDIYLDAKAKTVASNPYTLDSNATAQLYGTGTYHIIIKDSLGVVQFDYDYISPINSSFVVQQSREEQTATEGQTVFTLATGYVPSTNKTNLCVYINGLRQAGDAYTETDANTVTFSEGLSLGDNVQFFINYYDSNPATDSVANVTSLAALKTTDQTVYSKAITAYRTTTGDGGGGVWIWDPANHAADVTADTQEGIYVPPSTDATGASGAWVRQYSGALLSEWFGDTTVGIQCAIDLLNPGGELVLNTDLSTGTVLTVTSKSDIVISGGSIEWTTNTDHVFELIGTCSNVKFKGIKITSSQGAFVSKGAIGCSSGVITTNWTVEDCVFDGVPFGVYVNADASGSHTNPVVSGCQFKNAPRFANDSASGSGLGLVFASGGGTILEGKSINNYYYKCGRHSLYISNGGNVTSINDTFEAHRDDGGGIVSELAAIQIARDSANVTVIGPTFIGAKDTALTITAVQTASVQTFPRNIKVVSPKFIDCEARLIRLGNDTPSVNGYEKNITIFDVGIFAEGTAFGEQIAVLSGTNVTVDRVAVQEEPGATSMTRVVRLYGYGTTSEFNDFVLKHVEGTTQGGAAVGLYIDTRVATGIANVKVEDVTVGVTPIQYQTTPTNLNIIDGILDAYLQEYPLSSISNPNGTITARPGTIFLSRSGGTKATLWVKETTYGSGGWVAMKAITGSSAYSPTNVVTDRTYDANATTLDELADVVGTMIADLQAQGILG